MTTAKCILAMRIHISSETASALRNWKAFKISLRGQMDMKAWVNIFIDVKYIKLFQGKGKMTTYWLDGELDGIFDNESFNETLSVQSVEDDDTVKCP